MLNYTVLHFVRIYINREGPGNLIDCGPHSLENVVMIATRHVREGRNVTTDDNFLTCLQSLARELRKPHLTFLDKIV